MLRGKIELHNRVSVDSIFEGEKGTLGLIYTPGVAYVSKEIENNKETVYEYTSKWNNVAIICDGTRVLGLGNVGPEAAIPVMEGKSVLFKSLADINAIPLCIAARDKQEIIRFVKAVQPGFGAINIEDIESPKVLEIVETLKEELDIPVFHDDQHGTAVIALAALINALSLVGKKMDGIKAVIAGAGSAGYGIYRILQQAGCKNILVADSKGAIFEGRPDITSGGNNDDNEDDNENYRGGNSSKNKYRQEIAENTNPDKAKGSIEDIIRGADLFVGVSGKGNLVSQDMVRSMSKDAIVFALSNPDPEILPPAALAAGAKIAATGRSDFANQINNAVVFPAVLRALLDLKARYLDEDMLVAVSYAIASLVDRKHITENFIIPKVNDPRLLPVVTQTLRDAVMKHMDARGLPMKK